MKVVDFITIDNSLRLKQENEILKIERSEMEEIREGLAQLNSYKKQLGLI